MKFLIADDHANVRRGLRELLMDAFLGAQFTEACDGIDVLAQLAGTRPDVLLLDINMPGRSGFEVLKDVNRLYPLLPVIMVSVQSESQYALRCLRAGAAEYVNKDSVSETLVPVIRRILDNVSVLAPIPIGI